MPTKEKNLVKLPYRVTFRVEKEKIGENRSQQSSL